MLRLLQKESKTKESREVANVTNRKHNQKAKKVDQNQKFLYVYISLIG